MTEGVSGVLTSPMLPPRALIGMVHLQALPGSPRAARDVAAIAKIAADEARILADTGFDALIVENMHDAPYVNAPHAPETVAAMVRAALAVREAVPELPLGIQVLSFGHLEALAIAHAVGAQFIRVENFVYAHVADEGLLPNAAAGELLRRRRAIGATNIKVFADLKKKHASHALTSDLSVADAAHAAEFFGADGVIVTGAFTGAATSPEDVAAAQNATKLPVLVGSGVEPSQLATLFQHADALIIGSWIKRGGLWSNPVDRKRCQQLVRAAANSKKHK